MNITELLSDRFFLVLDGGLATELEKRGYDLSDSLWSAVLLADDPDVIRDVHMDYLKAGAEYIITASYQASIQGFMKKGYSAKESADLIRLSVDLAREAVDIYTSTEHFGENSRRPLVAGSVGSYGAFLADGSEYSGDYSLERKEYIDFHRPRVEILIDGGVDLIAFETFPRLDEALAAAELMKSFPGVPYWIVFTARDGSHISSGEFFSDCVSAFSGEDDLIGTGINCSPPELILPLLKSCEGECPFIVYPNSGEQFCLDSRSWAGEKNDDGFSSLVEGWYRNGAILIGGCCRTGPEDIHRIKVVRDALKNKVYDPEKG